MAFRPFRRLRELLDVDTSGASVGDALVLDADGETWVPGAGGGGGGPVAAADVSIIDAGGYYSSTDVEGALQEAGAAVGSIPTVAAATHAASSKTTPVDADEIPLADSAASFALKKLTWANLKATVKAYTDTLYSATGAYAPGGTDVAVTDGGTGASDAATARTNLGLAIGTNVQAYDAVLTTWAGLTPSAFFQTLVDDADAATARQTLAITSRQAKLNEAGGIKCASAPVSVLEGTPGHTATLTSQKVYASLVGALKGDTITNAIFWVGASAAGTGPTGMYAALYDTSGNRLAVSANQTTAATWTQGPVVIPFATPYAVTADAGFYIAILQNGSWGSTQPSFIQTISGGKTALAVAVSGYAAFSCQQSGQATMPNPATWTTDNVFFWMGWS